MGQISLPARTLKTSERFVPSGNVSVYARDDESSSQSAFHAIGFMLGEYKVSRCTRKCHALQRPLRDGEWYYSVVLESGDEFERRDYSAETWQGPPEAAIGWWKNRMPTADDKKMVLAPPEVLVDVLRQMEQQPSKAKSRYLLALMLMRRKIVRPAAAQAQASEDDNVLRVEVIATGHTIDVAVQTISRSESEPLLEQLNELLYCEADATVAEESAVDKHGQGQRISEDGQDS